MNKGNPNEQLQTYESTDDYMDIVTHQKWLIENREKISPEELTHLIESMAEFYGVRQEDIKFIKMEGEGSKKFNTLAKEGDNFKSLSKEPGDKYYGFTIRGKKQGYGHLYYVNGNLHTSGVFKNDKLNGQQVKSFYKKSNVLSYEGCMLNGFRNGQGTEFYKNGKVMYEGNFKNDEWHGDDVKIYHFEGG